MNNDFLPEIPAREYYTAQELADFALEWGGCATLIDDDGAVIIELERPDSIVRLDLGQPRSFTQISCVAP